MKLPVAIEAMTPSVHRIHRDFRLPVLLCRYSGKRTLVWALLALGMIVGRIVLFPLLPPPAPNIGDEFSHLLAADTFAHGRLANPNPPHPEFFESPNILVRPVYASTFQPGQDLRMALGEKVAGHPYWGVVLSGALMIFAFCWAADAWLPPQWALIAGALSAILFFPHYWMDSYWGGSLAAAGGALVVGGLGQVLKGRPERARWSLGAGAVVLFLTRTYEGAILCIAVLLLLAIFYWRSSPERRRLTARALVVSNLAVLLAAAAPAAWYNLRVTGRATQFPYALYMQQYDLSPPLWILPAYPPKQFSSANYQSEREWELKSYHRARNSPLRTAILLRVTFLLLGGVLIQFLSFGLLLAGVPWARMRGRKKWLLFLLGAGAAGVIVEISNFPHYTAPFTVVVLLLIVAAGRAMWYRMAALRRRGLVFAATGAVMLVSVVYAYLAAFEMPRTTPRSRLIGQLASQGGRHLVFVDYTPGFEGWEPDSEWVYNGADLDSSPVVFAHMRSDAENRALLDEFPGRIAWLVRVGPQVSDVHLERYPPHSSSVTASNTPR